MDKKEYDCDKCPIQTFCFKHGLSDKGERMCPLIETIRQTALKMYETLEKILEQVPESAWKRYWRYKAAE